MLVAGSYSASAQEPVKLIFAAQSPATSPNIAFYNEWVQRVNAAGQGKVVVELREGETIANFGNVYDRVTSDVIQIGWMIHSFYGAKFPLSDVVSLPFIVRHDIPCATAFWKMYEAGLLNEEFADLQPLNMNCGGLTYTHFAKIQRSPEDLAGKKVRTRSKVEGQVMQLLGGTPVTIAASEMYEGLQRGTIDAVNTSWAGVEPYKLHEVTQYHLEVPLGSAPMMHFMAKKKFQSLPKDVQDILMSQGGIKRSVEMGNYMDTVAGRARKIAVEAKHTIVQLTPEQTATWKAKVQPVVDDWTTSRKNGKEALAFFTKAHDEAAAQMK